MKKKTLFKLTYLDIDVFVPDWVPDNWWPAGLSQKVGKE